MKLFLIKDKIDFLFPRILVAGMAFYYLRTAFWPLTYLFVAVFTILVILFFIRHNWKFKISNFIIDYYPPIILAGIYILAFLLNGQYSNVEVQKDIVRLIILFSTFYLLFWSNSYLKQGIPKSFTYYLILITLATISILNIINAIFSKFIPDDLLLNLNISQGITLSDDYNFFCLFILLGLVILNSKTYSNGIKDMKYSTLVVIALNFLYIINVVLSGSRRGIVVFFVLALVYFLDKLSFEIKKFDAKRLFRKSIILLIVVVLFSAGSVIIIREIPIDKVVVAAYQYSSIAGINDFESIERKIWKHRFKVPKEKGYLIDPNIFSNCPEYWETISAEGTRLSNVKTPFGNGIKVKRETGNGGFSLYYAGPKIIYLANHTYKISFKIKFIHGDFDSYHVGWWVEDGVRSKYKVSRLEKDIESIGNGWYNCTSKYTFINNHIGAAGFINSVKKQSEFIIADFTLLDLDYDDSLPRFLFEAEYETNEQKWINKKNPPYYNDSDLIINGSFEYGLEFWKYSSDSLTIKIERCDSGNYAFISRGDGDGGYFSLYYVGRNIEFKENNEYQISFKMKPLIPKTIPFKVGFWVNEGDGFEKTANLKLQIDTLENGWLFIKANYKFKYNQSNVAFPIHSQIDNSQFYITDIRLTNLSHAQQDINIDNQEVDTLKNEPFYFGRTSRWLYALELWRTKYKWWNKIFGHGFKYLEWYGEKFYNNAHRYDWPHNPIITILLYSGILGLTFYLWLLYKVFYLYIKYRRKYPIIFICFLMTFFFSFFSANNPFDPPIMGFFVMLPFFINYIHKKDKTVNT